MKCNRCYKDMKIELKIRNRNGVIEKWTCKCGKKSLRSIAGKEIKVK